MKMLGLLGGMSWQSTQLYYSLLNEGVNTALGGVHSCNLILHSFDFHQIKEMQVAGKWSELAELLSSAATGLKNAGCNHLLICSNTMHKCEPQIQADAGLKIIHIVDAISTSIVSMGLNKIGFLGTKYSMEEDFLHSKYNVNGIETIIPNSKDRDTINRIIFDELVNGVIDEGSRNKLVTICNVLKSDGAQGIIAGCTEIELILRPHDIDLPLFQSTRLHCEMAISKILETEKV